MLNALKFSTDRIFDCRLRKTLFVIKILMSCLMIKTTKIGTAFPSNHKKNSSPINMRIKKIIMPTHKPNNKIVKNPKTK